MQISAQVAVAFTLAYPYGSAQILSSYAYSSHGQGAPKALIHGEGGLSIVEALMAGTASTDGQRSLAW